MRKSLTILALLCIAGSIGCSHTPGDAAYRGGHYEAAAELYRKGAEQGDGVAAAKLSHMYLAGKGVEKSYEKAEYWIDKAVQQGNVIAAHNFGVMHEYGLEGIVKDLDKAERWYREAAYNGYLFSQYNLGSMYSNGYISPPNDVEGYKWLILAQKAAKDCPSNRDCQFILNDPPGHMERLRERMSEEQIAEAEKLAENWKPSK